MIEDIEESFKNLVAKGKIIDDVSSEELRNFADALGYGDEWIEMKKNGFLEGKQIWIKYNHTIEEWNDYSRRFRETFQRRLIRED